MVAIKRGSLALFLLSAAFLAVQAFALAHATTHDFHSDTDHCSICLRAGQHKAIAVDASTAPAATPNSVRFDPQASSFHPANRPLSSRVRDPPFLTML